MLDQPQTDKPQSILATAFAGTDTISHGDFTITKKPGFPWKTAKAFADGIEVKLPAQQKKYLALLISQKGAPVTRRMFARETPESKYSTAFLAILDPKSTHTYKDEKKAKRRLSNLLNVIVCNIKKSMKEQGVPNDSINCIERMQVSWNAGETGSYTKGMTGAYQILLPDEPNPPNPM